MDFFEWGIRTIDSIVKHGLNLKIIFLSIITLYNVSLVRKLIRKRIPKRFRHEDIYESMQRELIATRREVRAVMSHLGVEVEWDARYAPVLKSQDVTDGQKNSLKRTWAMFVPVRTIGAFTTLTANLYHSKTRGESIQMKNSKWLSRKFILAVAGCAVIILNDMFELNVDKDTVFTFAGIIATWIATEGVVDVSKKPTEAANEKFTTSTEHFE